MEDCKPEKTQDATIKPNFQPDLVQRHNVKVEKLLATDQKNNISIQKEGGCGRLRAEADTVNSHAAESMTDTRDYRAKGVDETLIEEIDYIFESSKIEALNVIENAKRKAKDCVRKAMKQEVLPSPEAKSSLVRKTEDHVNNMHVIIAPRQKRRVSVKEMIEMVENRKVLSVTEEAETNGSESEHGKTAYKENAMETRIKDNLERYRGYISTCIKTTDLIAFYDLFTTVQTKLLRSIHKRSPIEATEKALDEISLMQDQPDKYRRLSSALKDAGYPKVVQILEGSLIPVGTRHRQTIRNCAKHIFQRLNTAEVLPYLYSKGIINEDDYQQIQITERMESTGIAALELLDLLPNRNERWYRYFVDSLVQSGHEDLAKIIEENTKQVIPGMKTPCLPKKRIPINEEVKLSDEILLPESRCSEESCEPVDH